MSTSRAADAGYLALQDLAAIAAGLGGEYRIVGGAMVGLLAAYYAATGLAPDRETVDADFGAAPELVADARLVQELQARGYQPREAANRFVRHDRDLPLVIDVLAPSFQGRLRANQRHGDLTVDE
ncbi:MAG: hypothetical protein ACRDQA_05395, partial [Nocardioidaceae bacterium]